jgi:plasmid stabilization system protein ParE
VTFAVRFAAAADEDLERLFDFLLDRAVTVEDLGLAQTAIDAVRAIALSQLGSTPYSFRKSGKSPARRELIIPFGATGYVALYEIASSSTVLVLAIRHQREEDFH